MHCNVAVIGGGPGGSTVGSLLRKYDPSLSVCIFEREKFPRDHVGESQLPGISAILNEMGVWDKVEAANFPIKIGATYRWGKSPELWDFHFYPKERFVDQARPAKYEGQRTATAFQVDRAIYDQILLDHARELGCQVFEETPVSRIERDGDRVTRIVLQSGEEVVADTYIDASGHSGILRRAMGVETECPTSLQNVAFWDYWQNAEWAVEIGVGATYVQVMSLGYGWIWFIPLGPERTSVGLILPAKTFKESGKRPIELYEQALQEEPRIRHLMRNAVSENRFSTTKDWSFLSQRHAGDNWFLVGEASGFADPILAAGLTITHASAREAANTILAERSRMEDPVWLREQYDRRQTARIRNHIRFADYWYTSNGQFKDLQEFTSQLAKDSGLDFGPERAWQWLAQGGFIDEDLTLGTGGYSLPALKALPQFLGEIEVKEVLHGVNRLELNLEGAERVERAIYPPGGVQRIQTYVRDGNVLPIRDAMAELLEILQQDTALPDIVARIRERAEPMRSHEMLRQHYLVTMLRGLEALVYDGWVSASHDPSIRTVDLRTEYRGLTWSDEVTTGAHR